MAKRPKRPFAITLWAAGTFLFAVFYLARFVNSLAAREFLQEILPFSPFYLTMSGLVFGSAGLAAAWGLWSGRAWARNFFWLVFLTYLGYFWLDRLLLPSSLQRNMNFVFVIAAQILAGLFSNYLFSRQKVKLFFGVWHEQKPENSKIA